MWWSGWFGLLEDLWRQVCCIWASCQGDRNCCGMYIHVPPHICAYMHAPVWSHVDHVYIQFLWTSDFQDETDENDDADDEGYDDNEWMMMMMMAGSGCLRNAQWKRCQLRQTEGQSPDQGLRDPAKVVSLGCCFVRDLNHTQVLCAHTYAGLLEHSTFLVCSGGHKVFSIWRQRFWLSVICKLMKSEILDQIRIVSPEWWWDG